MQVPVVLKEHKPCFISFHYFFRLKSASYYHGSAIRLLRSKADPSLAYLCAVRDFFLNPPLGIYSSFCTNGNVLN